MTREELNKDIRAKVSSESNKENTKKAVKTIIKSLVIIAILGTLFFTYTTYVSTAKVGVREYRIINEKIPKIDKVCTGECKKNYGRRKEHTKLLATSN